MLQGINSGFVPKLLMYYRVGGPQRKKLGSILGMSICFNTSGDDEYKKLSWSKKKGLYN